MIISDSAQGNFESKLVRVDRPLLRIPSLAIHLDRAVNENFKFNQESEFIPILGLLSSQLNEPLSSTSEENPINVSCTENHHPALLSVLAEELSVKADTIHDFEM